MGVLGCRAVGHFLVHLYGKVLMTQRLLEASEDMAAAAQEKSHKSGPSAKALAETDLQAVLSKGSGTREKHLGCTAAEP